MTSVTQRIKQIKQPYGGYIPSSSLTVSKLYDEPIILNDTTKAAASGLVVDYLTRYMTTSCSAEDAFAVSLMGARIYEDTYHAPGEHEKALALLPITRDLSDADINNLLKLVSYDALVRTVYTFGESPLDMPDFDQLVINDVRSLLDRSIEFIDGLNKTIIHSFEFTNGYTALVESGDGDFMTDTTLYDMKCVNKSKVSNKYTLQLLMYYILGINSRQEQYKGIRELAVWNPRYGEVSSIKVSDIPGEVILEVARDVVGLPIGDLEYFMEHWSKISS